MLFPKQPGGPSWMDDFGLLALLAVVLVAAAGIVCAVANILGLA